MRTALLLALTLALSAAAAPVPKAVKKADDSTLLEGRWVSVTLDHGTGHKPDTAYWLEFKEGKLSTGTNGMSTGFKEVPFTLDQTKSPKHIDIAQGAQTLNWIYQLDGDTLTWCHPSGGNDRPTGMRSDKPYCCTVWKRVKE